MKSEFSSKMQQIWLTFCTTHLFTCCFLKLQFLYGQFCPKKGINLHFLSYFISLNMINLGFDFSLILQYLVIYSEILLLYIPSCHKLLQECSYIVQNIQGKHFFSFRKSHHVNYNRKLSFVLMVESEN